MFNYYYDFLYVPIYSTRSNSGSTSSITFNSFDSSLYSFEFIVDDRNLGGTLHFDLESRVLVKFFIENLEIFFIFVFSHWFRRMLTSVFSDVYRNLVLEHLIVVNSIIEWSLRKIRWRFDRFRIRKWLFGIWLYNTIATGSFISVKKEKVRFSSFRSIDECRNTSLSLMFQISSSQCTKQQCGSYGICRIMTSQQNVFSTCSCFAGKSTRRRENSFDVFIFSEIRWTSGNFFFKQQN